VREEWYKEGKESEYKKGDIEKKVNIEKEKKEEEG
jgi:hypothetical protein